MPDIETVTRWDEQMCSRRSSGNASSEIPIVIYYNRCWPSSHCGCQSTARVCLGDRCGRGVDYGGMVGLCRCLGSVFICTSRFKLQLRPFPKPWWTLETSCLHFQRIKVASTFSQTVSAPTTRIYGPLLMKRPASS